MKKAVLAVAAPLIVMAFGATLAFPQASGNFSAAATQAACTLNTTTGALSPECPGSESNPNECYTLDAPIKVSNANGLALLVTPSMVTGLYTNTKVNSQLPTASAAVGIRVCLTVTNPDGSAATGAQIIPTDPDTGESCVVYDQRFQEISTGLFNEIATCVPAPTGQTCTTDADCTTVPAGSTVYCNNPGGAPGGGTCQAFSSNCDFGLILSTLSAHAFNFVVTVPGGSYDVNAVWELFGVSTTGRSTVGACVGPGTLTVTQTKVFSKSGSITF